MREKEKPLKEISLGDIVNYRPPYYEEPEQIVVIDIGEENRFEGTNFIFEDGQEIIGFPGSMHTEYIQAVIDHWNIDKMSEVTIRSRGLGNPLTEKQTKSIRESLQKRAQTRPRRVFP